MQDSAELEPEGDSLDDKESSEPEPRPDLAEGAEEDEFPSPSSQIGREQMGGSSASGQEPGTDTQEGWPMPDQSDTPPDWPEPTID